jgi:hypothetical protein
VAAWRDRAGNHCQQVHAAMVEQGQLDLVHVQADEIRVKGRKRIAWMGLAMMVSTRLWLAGTVQMSRDRGLADALCCTRCAEPPSNCVRCWCEPTAGAPIRAAFDEPFGKRSKAPKTEGGLACRSGQSYTLGR